MQKQQTQVAKTLSPRSVRLTVPRAPHCPCTPCHCSQIETGRLPDAGLGQGGWGERGCPAPRDRKASGRKHGRECISIAKRKNPTETTEQQRSLQSTWKMKTWSPGFCSLATHSCLFSTTFSKLHQLPFKKQQQKVL